MDELKALEQLRSSVPDPSSESKEHLWNQLQAEMNAPGRSRIDRPKRLSRAVKRIFAGLLVLTAVTLSPIGPAVADRFDGLLEFDDSGPPPTPRDRYVINRTNEEIQRLFEDRRATGTPAERFQISSALISAVAEEGSIAAGGGPGSVTISTATPLKGFSPPEIEELCARIDREIELRDLPENWTCELEGMIQSGQLPPGRYTKAKFDRLRRSGQ